MERHRPSRRRKEVQHYSDDNPNTFAVKGGQLITAVVPKPKPPAAKKQKRQLQRVETPHVPQDTLLAHSVEWIPACPMSHSPQNARTGTTLSLQWEKKSIVKATATSADGDTMAIADDEELLLYHRLEERRQIPIQDKVKAVVWQEPLVAIATSLEVVLYWHAQQTNVQLQGIQEMKPSKRGILGIDQTKKLHWLHWEQGEANTQTSCAAWKKTNEIFNVQVTPIRPDLQVHSVLWETEDLIIFVAIIDDEASLMRYSLAKMETLESAKLEKAIWGELTLTPDHVLVCTSREIQCRSRSSLSLVCAYGQAVTLHGKTLAWRSCELVRRPRQAETLATKKQSWCRQADALQEEPEDSNDLLLVGVPQFGRGPEELWSRLYVWDIHVPTQPLHMITTPQGGLSAVSIWNCRFGWRIHVVTAEHGIAWELSPAVASNFAGNMYPVGYQVVTDNLDFIEEEDALDFLVVDVNRNPQAAELTDENDQAIIDPEQEEVDVLGGDAPPISASVVISRELLSKIEDKSPPSSPTRATKSGGFLSSWPQFAHLETEQTVMLQDIAMPAKKAKRSRPTVETLLQQSVDPELRRKLLEEQNKWSLGQKSCLRMETASGEKEGPGTKATPNCAACQGRMVRHVCGKLEKPLDYEEIARREEEAREAVKQEKQRERTEKRRAADARRREAKKQKKLLEKRLREQEEQKLRDEELHRQQEMLTRQAEERRREEKRNDLDSYQMRTSHHPIPSFASFQLEQETSSHVPQQHSSGSPASIARSQTANETDALEALAGLAGLQSAVPVGPTELSQNSSNGNLVNTRGLQTLDLARTTTDGRDVNIVTEARSPVGASAEDSTNNSKSSHSAPSTEPDDDGRNEAIPGHTELVTATPLLVNSNEGIEAKTKPESPESPLDVFSTAAVQVALKEKAKEISSSAANVLCPTNGSTMVPHADTDGDATVSLFTEQNETSKGQGLGARTSYGDCNPATEAIERSMYEHHGTATMELSSRAADTSFTTNGSHVISRKDPHLVVGDDTGTKSTTLQGAQLTPTCSKDSDQTSRNGKPPASPLDLFSAAAEQLALRSKYQVSTSHDSPPDQANASSGVDTATLAGPSHGGKTVADALAGTFSLPQSNSTTASGVPSKIDTNQDSTSVLSEGRVQQDLNPKGDSVMASKVTHNDQATIGSVPSRSASAEQTSPAQSVMDKTISASNVTHGPSDTPSAPAVAVGKHAIHGFNPADGLPKTTTKVSLPSSRDFTKGEQTNGTKTIVEAVQSGHSHPGPAAVNESTCSSIDEGVATKTGPQSALAIFADTAVQMTKLGEDGDGS